MTSISNYLAGDSYAPPIAKDHLQQYDNYQIYSFYCLDRIRSVSGAKVYYNGQPFMPYNGSIGDASEVFTEWVAVQQYSPYREIPCNFRAIAIQYHS
jgi:hypothetical protein